MLSLTSTPASQRAGDNRLEHEQRDGDEPVTLTSLGLVNGYAKTSVDGSGAEFDLYAGSRRVLAVQWVLDGGTVIGQTLSDGERGLQRVDTGAVEVTGRAC